MPSYERHRPYFVYLDGELVDYLIPDMIEVSNNSGRLDHAKFHYDLSKYNEHVQNISTPESFERTVEIWFLTDNSNPATPSEWLRASGWKLGDPEPNKADLTPIFRGSITQQNIVVDSGESVQVVAQREAIDFGDPLQGYEMIPQHDLPNRFHDDIVFNPEIDGKIVGNMSSETFTGFGTHTGIHYFSDPEAKTEKSQQESGESSSEWTVQEAIRYLCYEMNSGEERVKNPTQADLDESDLWSNTPAIKNVLIKRGWLLPDALDYLLSPLGYTWHVERNEDSGEMDETIAPYKMFSGTEKTLKVAAFDAGNFDFDTTNTQQFVQRVNLGKVANQVILHGSLIRRQITVELYPAWMDSDDFIEPDLLQKSDPWGESLFAAHPNAWRLWLANEDGSISGLRFVNPKIDETIDLSSVFPDGYVRRARRALPLLTSETDGKVRPPFVEYEDPEEGWLPLPTDAHPSILKKKLGVYFAGDKISETLYAAFQASSGGNPPKLRMTCTIEGDRRLMVTSPKSTSEPPDVETTSEVEAGENGESIYSPKGKASPLFLDMSDTFHDRKVVDSGPHASTVTQGVPDKRNDWQAAQDYADKVLRQVDMCNVQSEATLPGLSIAYDLGDAITKVEGREVSFNLYSPGRAEFSAENKYPFISVIRWYPQRHITKVFLSGEAPHGF